MSAVTPEEREKARQAIQSGADGCVCGEHAAGAVDALIALGWAPAGVSSHPTREQIARVLWDANFPDIPWEVAAIEFNADALLAAGLWTTPAGGDVSTVEELDALPVGSVVQMTGTKAPFYRHETGWFSTHVPGKPVWDYLTADYLPARVLFVPSGSVPTETEGIGR